MIDLDQSSSAHVFSRVTYHTPSDLQWISSLITPGEMGQRLYIRETMHSALNLYCTIRTQLISATRGRASQPKVLAMATDCSATCQQG